VTRLLGKAPLAPDPAAVARFGGLEVARQIVVLDVPVDELSEHVIVERVDPQLGRPFDQAARWVVGLERR
jgi:hypothetical protein